MCAASSGIAHAALMRLWLQVKGLERPPPRHGHATCAIREKLFVFGGSSSEGQLLNDLWIYDQVRQEAEWADVGNRNVVGQLS
jgi:hypothetical protein